MHAFFPRISGRPFGQGSTCSSACRQCNKVPFLELHPRPFCTLAEWYVRLALNNVYVREIWAPLGGLNLRRNFLLSRHVSTCPSAENDFEIRGGEKTNLPPVEPEGARDGQQLLVPKQNDRKVGNRGMYNIKNIGIWSHHCSVGTEEARFQEARTSRGHNFRCSFSSFALRSAKVTRCFVSNEKSRGGGRGARGRRRIGMGRDIQRRLCTSMYRKI